MPSPRRARPTSVHAVLKTMPPGFIPFQYGASGDTVLESLPDYLARTRAWIQKRTDSFERLAHHAQDRRVRFRIRDDARAVWIAPFPVVPGRDPLVPTDEIDALPLDCEFRELFLTRPPEDMKFGPAHPFPATAPRPTPSPPLRWPPSSGALPGHYRIPNDFGCRSLFDRLDKGADPGEVLGALMAQWQAHLDIIDRIIRLTEEPAFQGGTFLVHVEPTWMTGNYDIVIRLPDGVPQHPPLRPPFLPVYECEDLSEYVPFYPGPVDIDYDSFEHDESLIRGRHPHLVRVRLEHVLPPGVPLPPAGSTFLTDLVERTSADALKAQGCYDDLIRLLRYAEYHPLSCHLHESGDMPRDRGPTDAGIEEHGPDGSALIGDDLGEDRETEVYFQPGSPDGRELHVRCPDPHFITYLLNSNRSQKILCAVRAGHEPNGEQVYPAPGQPSGR